MAKWKINALRDDVRDRALELVTELFQGFEGDVLIPYLMVDRERGTGHSPVMAQKLHTQ
jgi:hypothetical protein